MVAPQWLRAPNSRSMRAPTFPSIAETAPSTMVYKPNTSDASGVPLVNYTQSRWTAHNRAARAARAQAASAKARSKSAARQKAHREACAAARTERDRRMTTPEFRSRSAEIAARIDAELADPRLSKLLATAKRPEAPWPTPCEISQTQRLAALPSPKAECGQDRSFGGEAKFARNRTLKHSSI